MKKFNLEEAKAGKPVCTRIGLPVRIVCFDAACGVGAPILALVKQFGMNEQPMLFHTDGKAAGDCSPTYDLMMVSEKHEGWVNIYAGTCVESNLNRYFCGIFSTKEEAQKYNTNTDNIVDCVKVEWEE